MYIVYIINEYDNSVIKSAMNTEIAVASIL